MQDQSSLTAEYMALFRALESSRPAGRRLFSDPLAHRFLRQWRARFFWLSWFAPARRFVEWLLDRSAPGARAAGIARTRWLDDEVAQALATCGQLVLLGAGFDTRAYRLPCASHTPTFEMDHPKTSRAKQEVLAESLGSLPPRVRFVSIDFNRQSIAAVLDQAGFESSIPACYVWEGVTNYLSHQAVDRVLQQVGQSAEGSILLFTYIHQGVLDQPKQFFGAPKLMARLKSYGEPWIFGLYPEELGRYLEAHGLTLSKDLSVAEVWQEAGRSSRGSRGYEFYRLASAVVGPKVARAGSKQLK